MARAQGFGARFRSLTPAPMVKGPPKLPEPGTPGVLLVGGADGWLRQRVIHHCIRHHLGEDGETSFRLRRLNGGSASRAQVFAATRAVGFDGGPVVVVRDALRLTRPEANRLDIFSELVERPPAKAVVILEWEKAPDARWKGMKPLAEAVTQGRVRVFDCDPPAERSLANWIGSHARSLKLTLPEGAAEVLVARFGSDMRRIHNELEKLAVWSEDGAPSLDDLHTVLGGGSARDRYRFSGAVEAGRPAEALTLLAMLLAEGESPQMLLTLLYNLAVRIQIAQLAPRDQPLHDVLRVPAPVAARIQRAVPRFNRKELRTLLVQMADLDHKLKSTSLPPDVALAAVTLRLTAPPR